MPSPPPSPNLLSSLPKTPIESLDVEELRQFLYLLWDCVQKLEERIESLESP